MQATIKPVLVLVASLFLGSFAWAGEEEGDQSLTDELEELKEDDFPDLVGVDEVGGIMDEFALLQEEEIVFTASKHEQDIAESPSAITVITREQIENTHCTDVVCLLRQVPEVEVRAAMPMYAAVGARALAGELCDKMLVLVDGREINLETFGIPIWMALPVHPEDIERIEVIRGPVSALYGANAHSGVISIFTRTISAEGAEVFLGGGEHDRLSVHLRLEEQFGKWLLHLSGGRETSGNWRFQDRREREFNNLRLRLDHRLESATFSIQAGLTGPIDGEIFTSRVPTTTDDLYLGYLMLSYGMDWCSAKLSYSIQNGNFILDAPLYYGETKLGSFPRRLLMYSSSLDADVQFNWSWFEGNLLITGGNYRWITMLSETNDPGTVHQHRVGFFVHDEQRLGDSLILSGGVRFDYNSITPFSVSPRVAGNWRFADNQFLRMAFGRAFRKPSFFNTSFHIKGSQAAPGFEDLADFIQRSLGNPHLQNESITTIEAGYRGRFMDRRLTVEAEVFCNFYRDTITLNFDLRPGDFGLPDLKNSRFEFRNEGREVNSLGGSLAVVFRIRDSFFLGANYTFRHSWYIADSKDYGILEGGRGDRVAWEPAHLFNLSLHYLQRRGLCLGASLFGISENDTAMPEHGGLFDDYVMVHLPTRVVLSAFVGWRLLADPYSLEMGVRAYNLLNYGFRDTQAVTLRDGGELGGELIGRRIFVFVRGSI